MLEVTHSMQDIFAAARVLGGDRLHSAYRMMELICQHCYPSIDAITVRVVLPDEKGMAPFAKSSAWVYWAGPPYTITVLERYQHSVEDLFTTLLHELNHIRQHQLAPGELTTRTCHRVESWRQGAFEAANALWPGVFERCEFVGVPGRPTKDRRPRLDDKTLHHFPDSLRDCVEAAGHSFVSDWAANCGL